MNIERGLGTDEWFRRNPEKFCIYNAQYGMDGSRFPNHQARPWVAVGGDYYRHHETFQDALNYALDMGPLI